MLELHAFSPLKPLPEVRSYRLTAWKKSLTDEAFAEGVCSSCAQSCSRRDLVSAVFPPKSAATPPEWLKWSQEQWTERSDVWYDQLKELLDPERVLQRQFSADDRVRNAELAASQVRESLTDTSVAANDETRKIAIKEAFAHRVCKRPAVLEMGPKGLGRP